MTDRDAAPDVSELVEDDATLQEVDAEPPEEISLEHRKVFTDKSDPPIGSLLQRYLDGDLALDPLFQRRAVWEDSRSSRLIESVILEVPLPLFYLAEDANGKQEVIDGQQRLKAFFRFLQNEYPLSGLKALPQLKGKYFKDLEKPMQRLVRDSPIRTIMFKKESDENLRFEIFERLNTGAVPLNSQELRNCVYRGPYNEKLISLGARPDYMFLMGLKASERRMRDVEYVLRFAAFYHATYLKYRPPISTFLDQDMRKHRLATNEQLEELESAFKNAVYLVRSLLGLNAFRRYYRGTEKNPNGRWEPKKFNAALYDILMYSFADKDKNLVMANLDAIREALIVQMTENQPFIDAIELSTSSVRMVTTRFDIWRKALDDILADETKQPRLFTRELKLQLYSKNRTCGLCGNSIADPDDAAVDHIQQYWLGGKTDFDNARLAHRYCNWSRPRRESGAPAPPVTSIGEESPEGKGSGQPKTAAERHLLRLKFWESLLKRAKELGVLTHASRSAGSQSWIGGASGRSGMGFNYVVWMDDDACVELYIDTGDRGGNKAIFDSLIRKKAEIEKAFGGPLEWERLDERRASRIRCTLHNGGLSVGEAAWPKVQEPMIDAMRRLVDALKPFVKTAGT